MIKTLINMKNNDLYKAIIWIICSAFFFALMNLFVRLSGDLPAVQKSFFRNFVAFFFALAVLIKSERKFSFRKKNLPQLIARSVAGTAGILCNFYAVDHLVLSDASILNKLSPFFAIVCSLFILKERLNTVQISAVLIAFGGAVLVVKPGFADDGMLFPALVGVFGGFAAGLAYTFVRLLGQSGERGPFIVFFFSGFSCLVTLPFLIFDFHTMNVRQLILLLFAGLSATGGQFTITAAYTHAPARDVSVYDYTQIIFAAALGLIFFNQVPDLYSVFGYVVIAGVAGAMFLYNKHRYQNIDRNDAGK